MHPLLEQPEVRAPLPVERDEFTVQQQRPPAAGAGQNQPSGAAEYWNSPLPIWLSTSEAVGVA
jgi:hypothetical protein